MDQFVSRNSLYWFLFALFCFKIEYLGWNYQDKSFFSKVLLELKKILRYGEKGCAILVIFHYSVRVALFSIFPKICLLNADLPYSTYISYSIYRRVLMSHHYLLILAHHQSGGPWHECHQIDKRKPLIKIVFIYIKKTVHIFYFAHPINNRRKFSWWILTAKNHNKKSTHCKKHTVI